MFSSLAQKITSEYGLFSIWQTVIYYVNCLDIFPCLLN